MSVSQRAERRCDMLGLIAAVVVVAIAVGYAIYKRKQNQ